MSRMPGPNLGRRAGTLLRTLGLITTVTLVAATATASQAQYRFTGSVTAVSGPTAVTPGDAVVGLLRYDPGMTGGPSPDSGTQYTGPVELTFSIGDQTFNVPSPASTMINVLNSPTTALGYGGDRFVAATLGSVDPTTGTSDFLTLSFNDLSGTTLTSEALPTTQDLARFMDGAFLSGIIGNQVIAAQVVGVSPVPIPEPAAWTILGLGLVGWVAANRRSRSRSAA